MWDSTWSSPITAAAVGRYLGPRAANLQLQLECDRPMEELEQECRIRLAARSLTRWAQASELAGVRLAQAVLAVHCAWLQLWQELPEFTAQNTAWCVLTEELHKNGFGGEIPKILQEIVPKLGTPGSLPKLQLSVAERELFFEHTGKCAFCTSLKKYRRYANHICLLQLKKVE